MNIRIRRDLCGDDAILVVKITKRTWRRQDKKIVVLVNDRIHVYKKIKGFYEEYGIRA
jgi:hypothetical protein